MHHDTLVVPVRMAGTDFPHSSCSLHDPVTSPYMLVMDATEGQRLNLQYAAIKYSTGDKRILAPVQLNPGDKVLDCATGTGVWLLDVASVSPTSVSFHGIDISPQLFPPTTRTPPNVSFSQRSVLDPPPEFASTFTLINQRLLTVALRAAEWPAAFRVHFEMLRPGGWTQLCEIDFAGFSRPDGACTGRMHAMIRGLFTARGLDWECAERLEGWAHDAGFINVNTWRTRVPVGGGATRLPAAGAAGGQPHDFTKPLLSGFMALKAAMLETGCVSNEHEYEQALHDLEAEWNEMDDAYYPFVWCWAQKPIVTA